MEYATESLVLARQLKDRGREGRLTELIGHLYSDTLRDPERAAVYFNQALQICRETNNRYEEAWTLWGMGSLALLTEDYTTALARYNEARGISEDIGATLQVGWDLYRMGNAWYNLGDYIQALDCYQQAHAIFDTAHHPRGQIYAFISRGLVYLATDRLEEAAEQLEKAGQQAEERNDLSLMCQSYEALVAYYCRLGGDDDLTNAIRLSNRIIHLAAERHNFEHELLGYYLRGASFLLLGKLTEAMKNSTRALSQLEQLNYIDSSQITVAEIYYTHSQIAEALGQRDTAAAFLQKAYRETMRKANLIPDETLRVSFLNNVSINQEIVAASRRLRPQ
jgi:tetratricopeptide (TPR) repeat protein